MNITQSVNNGILEMGLAGRLDAASSDFFFNAITSNIREGRQKIRVDASELEYLSSAGLRVLLRSHRELAAVGGSFAIVRASEFVVNTLSMSGFDSLLALETESEKGAGEPDSNGDGTRVWEADGLRLELHVLDEDASMDAALCGGWKPWQSAQAAMASQIELGRDCIALGIGCPGGDFDKVRDSFGDFLAAAGCSTWMPPGGTGTPDYLVQEGRFTPGMLTLSAIRATGDFSHLLRFQPSDTGARMTLPALATRILAVTRRTSAAFAALAEVDGLVGLSTTRSPGIVGPDDKPAAFPEVCDWLSFSGERVHEGALALLVGFIDASGGGLGAQALPPLPSKEGMHVHVHAAVFPFHPLANGKINMAESVAQLFAGAEPVALLHLVE
ncbi:MAG TPA: STAS domain-containing protein, partial [Opitutales bacterium]|nr:STAS domain-containing protein [Opitutales bacterium]